MKALLYDAFGVRPRLCSVADPRPPSHGVVIRVMASGVCRSDWHGWVGHDADIRLPHVPGHEFAGVVVEAGPEVRGWAAGDRVTMPFVAGCGSCLQCQCGNQQVCDHQFQPGFTHWGSFAEYVAIPHADLNLVRLPDSMDYATAASLGCRFATAFRAVVDQGRVAPGQWVAVHGCGGVGLSAIMIARAAGARVVAVDIAEPKLALARAVGASASVDAERVADVVQAVRDITGGGAHVSLDALGHTTTCLRSIANLRKRGRHVQVGLLLGEHAAPAIPMGKVVADELEILGSHGMQAHRYRGMLDFIESAGLAPQRLIGNTVDLEQAIDVLVGMDRFSGTGVTVVTRF